MPAETVRGGTVAEAFAGAEDEHVLCGLRIAGALNLSEGLSIGGVLVGFCVCARVC